MCYVRKSLPLLALKMVAISARNTIMRKFANFVRLYFPRITTFSNQILGFYYFTKVLFGNLGFFVGLCLDKKIVYNGNCLLDKGFQKNDTFSMLIGQMKFKGVNSKDPLFRAGVILLYVYLGFHCFDRCKFPLSNRIVIPPPPPPPPVLEKLQKWS